MFTCDSIIRTQAPDWRRGYPSCRTEKQKEIGIAELYTSRNSKLKKKGKGKREQRQKTTKNNPHARRGVLLFKTIHEIAHTARYEDKEINKENYTYNE